MTIANGLGIDKSPWRSTSLKDSALQGVRWVGKKMNTQILHYFFPPYT